MSAVYTLGQQLLLICTKQETKHQQRRRTRIVSLQSNGRSFTDRRQRVPFVEKQVTRDI